MESVDTPSAPSTESRIREILDDYRSFAYNHLDDLMQAAYLEIGRVLSEGTDIPPRSIHGLSPLVLRLIRKHALDGNLEEWLMAGGPGEKERCLLDFLNYGSLQMKSFRARFPRAFTKWTEEEDAALLDEYKQQSGSGRPIRWGEMSDRLGRNPNALKLRLEHLGENLGADAGRSRRPGGN